MGRETNKNRREKQAVNAREKAAAARAQARQQEQRRRAVAVISTIAVIAVVAVVVVVIAINHKGKQTAVGNRAPANSTVVSDVSSVSDATINKVGKGTADAFPKKVTDTALTANGLPKVLFVGAEFCPYCAAERWPLIQALSRFGTFSGLNELSSSSTDVDANTPTFSFYKSKYTSKYLAFTPYEAETRTEAQLDEPSGADKAAWFKYTGQGTFPFIDYGGKYVQTTQSFDPGLLDGSTQSAISSQLNDPSSKFSQAIVGGANVTTAAICKLTNNQPSNVCTASGVVAAAASLGS